MDFVNFYKGDSTAFSNIEPGKYVAGAFYLTTDTERLYFANTSSSILDLNQYIITVESVDALSRLTKPATHGDFYYCEAENVLCYYDNGWKQININTDTTTQEITTSKTVNEETDTITLQLYFKEQSSSSMTNAKPVEFTKTWEITKADIYDIIPEPKVDVVAAVAEDMSLEIKTSGDGSAPDGIGIHLIPGDNISFSDAGNSNITINSAVYTLGSEANSTQVYLKDNLEDDASEDKTLVTFEAGHQISVSGEESNKIKYSHGSITTTEETAPEQQVALWGMSVPHIQSLRFKPTAAEGGGDANGHVYGYTKHTLVMPEEPSYKIDEFKLGENPGDLVLTISDHAGTASPTQSSSAELKQGLYYRIINENGEEETYYNTQVLPVYTIEQVEKRLQGLNAITYKGTTNESLPTIADNVRVGDAWMATQHGHYGDSTTVFVLADGTVAQPGILEHVEPGDLFIARGTEDVYDGVTGGDAASGYITSDLQWTYIPAGNDYDSQYYLTHNNNTISLTSNATSNPDMANSFNGSITFQQDHTENDDVLVVCADDQKPTGAEAITVTYKHKEYGENDITDATHSEALSYDDSFTAKVIDEISNGHVASYHTQTYVMPSPQKVEINSKANEATLYLTDDTRTTQNIVKFLNDTETLSNGTETTIIEAKAHAANQIKFKHRRTSCTGPKSTVNDSLAWSTQYGFITSLTPTAEGDGHLQEFVYSNLTMPNDPSIKKVELSAVTNTEHEVSIKEHFYSPDGQTRDINNTTTYKTSTDSLQLSVAVSGDADTNHAMTATVNVDLVWKEFPGVKQIN